MLLDFRYHARIGIFKLAPSAPKYVRYLCDFFKRPKCNQSLSLHKGIKAATSVTRLCSTLGQVPASRRQPGSGCPEWVCIMPRSVQDPQGSHKATGVQQETQCGIESGAKGKQGLFCFIQLTFRGSHWVRLTRFPTQLDIVCRSGVEGSLDH